MKVDWKDAGDPLHLTGLVATTPGAKHRDRYRVVLLAGQGLGDRAELGREQIALATGRSRQFVDQWVGRYRRGGRRSAGPQASARCGASAQRRAGGATARDARRGAVAGEGPAGAARRSSLSSSGRPKFRPRTAIRTDSMSGFRSTDYLEVMDQRLFRIGQGALPGSPLTTDQRV